jgi:hypothetical protein
MELLTPQNPFRWAEMDTNPKMTHAACSDMGHCHFSSKTKQELPTDFVISYFSQLSIVTSNEPM